MNILLLGGGGREHALAWKMKQSEHCDQLFIAPGNPGTMQLGVNVNVNILDFESVATFCLENNINLLVVGPEEPLVKGIYDYFQQESIKHIQVIGPSQHGAKLEGSKAFAKEFMQKHNIPTATYREFSEQNFEQGINYIKNHNLPIVLKADGLAAGKGVVIAETHDEALLSFTEMIQEKKFGEASANVVIEEFLTGVECSVFVLTNGQQYVLLPNAKDYKRIGEGDRGLNTGGMGAISPVPFANEEFMQKVISRIVEPTIAGLKSDSIVYHGFVFIGLIKVNEDPYVIEYNCRMGDPETEVVMPRLENDIIDLFIRLKQNTLNNVVIKHSEKHAATVMMVSGGYPEQFEKGKEISGIELIKQGLVFHAGTTMQHDKLLSNGGRVIALTSMANDLSSALDEAKLNASTIKFDGSYYRKDIGWEFI